MTDNSKKNLADVSYSLFFDTVSIEPFPVLYEAQQTNMLSYDVSV